MKCQGTLNWRRKRLLCRDCLVWGKVLCSTAWRNACGWMCRVCRAAPLVQCIKGVNVQLWIWGTVLRSSPGGTRTTLQDQRGGVLWCYRIESGCATTGNTGRAQGISISLSLCLQIQPCINSKTLPSMERRIVKTVHEFPVFVQWPFQLRMGIRHHQGQMLLISP